MKGIFCLIILLPFLIEAQEDKGIKFEKGLSWEQVLAKAKAENKYLFVDCFATWCGPCKLMDKEVYPKKAVGDYMNTRYISVKVQVDTSKGDDQTVKSWYRDAHAIREAYKVSVLPSYLFFSPEGRLVHEFTGAIRDTDFIRLAANAINPDKQYYTLLENYRQGKKDFSIMPYLIKYAVLLRDAGTTRIIAEDYLHNHLDRLEEEALYAKENLGFIAQFSYLLTSKDAVFTLLYRHPDRVNDIMKGSRDFSGFLVNGAFDFAGYLVSNVITREEITAKIWKDNKPLSENPDWDAISVDIAKKYNRSYSDMLVLNARLSFYSRTGNWKEFAVLRDKKIELYPPKPPIPGAGLGSDTWGLNVDAWQAFLHCDDKVVLTKALAWSELSIKLEEPAPNIEYTDTRANLLYKIGRIDEAIAEEEKISQSADNLSLRKIYEETVVKMKNGIPTWSAK
jgi:thioredoxin-related protein